MACKLGLVTVCTAALLFNTYPVQSQSLPPLSPLGKWRLEYGDQRCVLSRDLGVAREARTFALVSEWGGIVPELLVIDPRPSRRENRSFGVQISVDGLLSAEELTAQSKYDNKSDERLTRISLTPSLKLAMTTARTINVTGSDFELSIATSGLSKAYARFDACARELAAKLGLDMTMRDAVVQPAVVIGNPSRFFGPDAYSRAEFEKRTSNIVHILLTIDTHGNVAACKLLLSSGSASVDAQICAISIRRIKFKAAQDKAGNAVPVQRVFTNTWQGISKEL